MTAQLNTEATATATKIEILTFINDVKGKKFVEIYSFVDHRDPATFEAYKAEVEAQGYTGLVYMTWDQFQAIEAEQNKDRYNLNKPKAIDAERFDDMLNVLPPERWQRGENVEIFMSPEGLTGNIYSFYVCIKSSKQYFEVNADASVNYSDLTKWCLEA